MKTRYALSISCCALAATALTGCGTTGTVARGQSEAIQPAGFQAHDPYAPGPYAQAAHDHIYDQHTSYYNNGGPGGPGCPPGGAGQGQCPPGGQGGMNGQCPHGCPPGGRCQHGYFGHIGPDGDWYPTHRYTHSYNAPQNLSYPAQNSPAGAVVYPYYTHKGPSDFFRAH